MPKVSALHLYPIKGCAGVSVEQMTLDALGPSGDRRFMIVDGEGRFITQRTLPNLALIRTHTSADTLTLSAPGMPSLSVALRASGPARTVEVWRDRLEAISLGVDAQRWLGDFLGVTAELVRFDERIERLANPQYAPPQTRVAFADAYPILLISEASLDGLNAKLDQPLPMDRFRPNLVVRDTFPYAEDGWARVRIGGVTLDVVKPCDRCSVTTVDQRTAVSGKEPLKTLATYRRRDNKIYFGQNVVHRAVGTLRVGDDVEVVETRAPMVFEHAVGTP